MVLAEKVSVLNILGIFMKRSISAMAAALALVASGATSSSATTGTDAAVDITKTGGILGLYANGNGYIKNTGTTTIPAGAKFTVEFHNQDHASYEVHANTVTPGTGLSSIGLPISGFGPWTLQTTQPLAPGQKFSYSWIVLHYAPWHRVMGHADLVSLPGAADVYAGNNHDTETNGGGGF